MSPLDFPHTREAPAEIARALQVIDPRAVVLWWGPMMAQREETDPKAPWKKRLVPIVRPVWLVGIVDPRHFATELAARRLRQLDQAHLTPAKDPATGSVETRAELEKRARAFHLRWQLARLHYQGFRETFFWPARDLDSGVVREFEVLDWAYRHLFETNWRAEMRRMEQEGETGGQDLTDRQAAIAEAVRATMPDIWRHTMRGRRSILVPSRAA